jgi:2-methylisocitrate lyase-like PEP mutase family enzyme
LLDAKRLVVAPGAYDGLTAKLIQAAGFQAVYMTGGGTSAGYGYPDYGLLTMSEMTDNAGRISDAVDLPVISDADNGYGNELNVYRTVRAFEKAGVSAIHIEDQAFPKRCGHLDDKELVSEADYLAKIRAASAARRSRDFLIIARTDARASLGFDAAVDRCNRSLEAGADVAFLEAPQTLEEVSRAPREIAGPCLLNVVRGGKTPDLDLREAERMGYAIAIVPGLLLAAVMGACDEMLGKLKSEMRHPVPSADLSPAEMFARVGADEWGARRVQRHQGLSSRFAAESQDRR